MTDAIYKKEFYLLYKDKLTVIKTYFSSSTNTKGIGFIKDTVINCAKIYVFPVKV